MTRPRLLDLFCGAGGAAAPEGAMILLRSGEGTRGKQRPAKRSRTQNIVCTASDSRSTIVPMGQRIFAGSRVKYIGKVVRRYIGAGDETTVLGGEWNDRQAAMMLLVAPTQYVSEAAYVRVWPAEVKLVPERPQPASECSICGFYHSHSEEVCERAMLEAQRSL